PVLTFLIVFVTVEVVVANALSHKPRLDNAELSAVVILVASSVGHLPSCCVQTIQYCLTSSSLLTTSLKFWVQVSKLFFTSGGGSVDAC
ncbi:hypothetical protein LINPERHAP1_LOCUS3783, partial [Linum perenne]